MIPSLIMRWSNGSGLNVVFDCGDVVEKVEGWIESEKLYEVVYEFEMEA